MKPDAKPFLEKIIAEPDDDSLRLVFADWLEESGEPQRAELIRVQVERATLPKWHPQHLALLAREKMLLARHEQEWREALPRIKGVNWGSFRRGFVATAVIEDYSVLKAKAAACQAVTPLEGLALNWPELGEEEGLPELPWLKEITVFDTIMVYSDVVRLMHSPLMKHLETLNLRDCGLGHSGVEELRTSQPLGKLQTLRIPNNRIGDWGVAWLADADAAKIFPSLKELDLAESGGAHGRYREDPRITHEGMTSLAGWEGLKQIESLRLSGNSLRVRGFNALMNSEYLGNLKQLILRKTGLRAGAMKALAEVDTNMQLEVLDLGENMILDAGLNSLAKAKCLSELKSLSIDRCELKQKSAATLADSSFYQNLRTLNVSHNTFTSAGMKSLLIDPPPHLHRLEIANNDLDNDGGLQLVNSSAAAGMQFLDLSSNQLTDAFAEGLLSSDKFGKLRVLKLMHNHIGKSRSSQRAFATSPLSRQLVPIDLDEED